MMSENELYKRLFSYIADNLFDNNENNNFVGDTARHFNINEAYVSQYIEYYCFTNLINKMMKLFPHTFITSCDYWIIDSDSDDIDIDNLTTDVMESLNSRTFCEHGLFNIRFSQLAYETNCEYLKYLDCHHHGQEINVINVNTGDKGSVVSFTSDNIIISLVHEGLVDLSMKDFETTYIILDVTDS